MRDVWYAPLRVFGFVGLATVGCQEEQVPVHLVEVTVVADGEPLPGAQVTLEGHPPLATDAAGAAQVRHQAPDGTRLRGTLTCPEGFATTESEFNVALTLVQSLTTGAVGPIRVSLTCTPTERENVLLIKTGFPGIGVDVDGRSMATTDAQGFAHVYLKRKPDSRIGVTLSTAALPKLLPVDPKMTFVTKDRDEVFVYAQVFEEEKVKKPKRRKAKPPPKKHIPIRL